MRLLFAAPLLPAVLGLASCYVTVPFQGLPRGAEAPPLEIEQWVNTEAPPRFDGPRPRPLLVEFWSSDCPPCMRSLPKVRRVAEARAGALDVVLVHVDLDRDDPTSLAELERLAEDHGLDVPIGLDVDGQPWDLYDFGHLPHAVLVEPDGRVRWSGNLVLYDLEPVLARRLGSVESSREPSAPT